MVTREDIAKKAGVSVSAVSRTMNCRGYVAKDKKERILQAVQELGYRPNPLSNSLKNKQTYQLCFFNSDMANPFYREMFEYMSEYAEKKGYVVFLCSTFSKDRFKNMLMDGIILENESVAVAVQKSLGEQYFIPMVSASYGVPILKTKHIPYVDVDTYKAMEMALDYLEKQRHKNIAYITPYQTEETETVQCRNVAFKNIMSPKLGEKLEQNFVLSRVRSKDDSPFANENFYEEGIRAADVFHERNTKATAVVCFNDEFALGFMNRISHLGYRIPDDISIIGIDGIKGGQRVFPQLTTIALNIQKQAECCVDVLLDVIQGKAISNFTYVKPYLIKGETVKKL